MLDHARVDQAVVARAPLRIPLGGGGTDLPSHYRQHGGFAVSATIDRHVHVLLSTAFARRFRLKHLEWEEVERPEQIRHPILRAAVEHHWDGTPFELASVGDVLPGTGLGSSSAYTVGVLQALATARGEELAPEELAARACRLEIEHVGQRVGVRDQYAIAVGGVTAATLGPGDDAAEGHGSVAIRRLELPDATLAGLGERFLLFFAGERREASQSMLSPLIEGSGDARMTRNLERTAELARDVATALETGDLAAVGGLMEEQWALKLERAPAAVTDRIAELHDVALGVGRAGGAVLGGAGGGGVLLVYSEDPEATRAAMAGVGAPELRFAVEQRGCTAGPACASCNESCNLQEVFLVERRRAESPRPVQGDRGTQCDRRSLGRIA
jgi:D-glycero-alpha-D-manno-heptose-7-phosphate kinase